MTEPTTIPVALARAVADHGADEALVDGDMRLTWAQLDDEVERAGGALVAAGVAAGDRVGIWAPNSWRWVVAALATTSVGAVLVPLSSRNVGREVADVVERGAVSVLFVDRGFLGKDYLANLRDAAAEGPGDGPEDVAAEGPPVPGLDGLRVVCLIDDDPEPDDHPSVPSWSEFVASAGDGDRAAVVQRRDAVGPDDVADIIFTSGTTGRPKGAVCEHGQNLFTYQGWAERVGLRTGDRYLVINPLSHSFGYKAGLLACVLKAATVVTVPTLDVARVMGVLADERITVMPGAPALYRSLLDHPDRVGPLPNVRMAATGGADVPVHLVEDMRAELGIPEVLTAYGLSEAAGTVTVSRPDDDPDTIANRCGTTIRGVEVRTVDEDGVDVGVEQPGEVVVRGRNVMRGYLDDPDATAAAIDDDGWLHTGDVGILDDRGYLRITDRLKYMFPVGGFNVYPAEVESVLTSRADITDAAVIGIDDDRLGQVPMAYVTPAAGRSIDVDELLSWCREHMANYKVPRRVEITSELPRNALGKVLKHELPR